jgi:hypothetical protein
MASAQGNCTGYPHVNNKHEARTTPRTSCAPGPYVRPRIAHAALKLQHTEFSYNLRKISPVCALMSSSLTLSTPPEEMGLGFPLARWFRGDMGAKIEPWYV